MYFIKKFYLKSNRTHIFIAEPFFLNWFRWDYVTISVQSNLCFALTKHWLIAVRVRGCSQMLFHDSNRTKTFPAKLCNKKIINRLTKNERKNHLGVHVNADLRHIVINTFNALRSDNTHMELVANCLISQKRCLALLEYSNAEGFAQFSRDLSVICWTSFASCFY